MNREFENFRQLVLADESLQRHLRDLSDLQEFVSTVVELGSQNRYIFTAGDVEEAIRSGRRILIEG